MPTLHDHPTPDKPDRPDRPDRRTATRARRSVRRVAAALVFVTVGSVAACTGAPSTLSTGGTGGTGGAGGSTSGTGATSASTVDPSTTRPGGTTGGTPTTATVDLAGALDGRAFEATSARTKGADHPLAAGTKLTLELRAGQVSASAGCNSMSGSYQLAGDVLEVRELATTDMACMPAERMEQDAWFSGVLTSSPRLRLEGSELVVDAPEATIVFVDRKVADPDRPLAGTHWVADTVIDGAAASSIAVGATPPSLDFGADGSVRGFSGCAPLTGRFTVDGARMTLDRVVVADAAACTREGEALDRLTRGVLQGAVTFEIDGPRLRLTNGDRGLQLRAA